MKLSKKLCSIGLACGLLLSLTACADKDSGEKKESAYKNNLPTNLTLYGKSELIFKPNDVVYRDIDAFMTSKEYKDSKANYLTDFVFIDLLNKYIPDSDVDNYIKALKKSTTYKELEGEDSKNFITFNKNKEKTLLLLQKYFDKDLKSLDSITTFKGVYKQSFMDELVSEKDFKKSVDNSRAVLAELNEKTVMASIPNNIGKSFVADLSFDTSLQLLNDLNQYNSKTKINKGDVISYVPSSKLYNPELYSSTLNSMYSVKILDVDKVKFDSSDTSSESYRYATYYLAVKEFSDNEQKLYNLIKFMDDKLKDDNLPLFIYKGLASESAQYPTDFKFYFNTSPDLYLTK